MILGKHGSSGFKAARENDSLSVSAFGLTLTAVLLLGGALLAQDVAEIDLYKRARYRQVDDSGPTLLPVGQYPFELDATVWLSNDILNDPEQLDFLAGMVFRTPAGTSKAMDLDPSFGYTFADEAVSAVLLNTWYGAGTYRFTLSSLIYGPEVSNVTLGADDYPPAPRVLNFPTTQSIAPAQDFTLQWTSFSGAGDRYATVEIWDADSGVDVYFPPLFDAAQTSVVIPAGTFEPGKTYEAVVVLIRITFSSGATTPALSSGFEAYTRFQMQTTALQRPVIESIRARPDGGVDLSIRCTVGRNLVVQGMPGIGGSWRDLQTVTPEASPKPILVPAADLGNLQILRAYQQ